MRMFAAERVLVARDNGGVQIAMANESARLAE